MPSGGPFLEMREENPAYGVTLVSHFSYKARETRQIRPQEFGLKWLRKKKSKNFSTEKAKV